MNTQQASIYLEETIDLAAEGKTDLAHIYARLVTFRDMWFRKQRIGNRHPPTVPSPPTAQRNVCRFESCRDCVTVGCPTRPIGEI